MNSAPIILVKNGGPEVQERWTSALGELLRQFEVRGFDDSSVDPQLVRYVVAWRPDALWLNSFRHLHAVFSIGSGVDHIDNLDQLRPDIPVVRTVSTDLTQRMLEFVTMATLAWHRRLPEMIEAAARRDWERFVAPLAGDLTVGILGFGTMGQAVGHQLSNIGYNTRAWSKNAHIDPNVEHFSGPDTLDTMVTGCDVLICLLPLTSQTREIVNESLLNRLNKGSCLINVSRGSHIDYAALKSAVESGQVSCAILDGLPEEPLPPSSPLWELPGVIITGHSAAYISPAAGPTVIAQNIARFDAGQPVGPLYDRSLGY